MQASRYIKKIKFVKIFFLVEIIIIAVLFAANNYLNSLGLGGRILSSKAPALLTL